MQYIFKKNNNDERIWCPFCCSRLSCLAHWLLTIIAGSLLMLLDWKYTHIVPFANDRIYVASIPQHILKLFYGFSNPIFSNPIFSNPIFFNPIFFVLSCLLHVILSVSAKYKWNNKPRRGRIQRCPAAVAQHKQTRKLISGKQNHSSYFNNNNLMIYRKWTYTHMQTLILLKKLLRPQVNHRSLTCDNDQVLCILIHKCA